MVIDKNTLIANQALKIAKLQFELKQKNKSLSNIKSSLICIGGPLNDNVDEYSVAQRSIFHYIMEQICYFPNLEDPDE
jgi:hypothetical protein